MSEKWNFLAKNHLLHLEGVQRWLSQTPVLGIPTTSETPLAHHSYRSNGPRKWIDSIMYLRLARFWLCKTHSWWDIISTLTMRYGLGTPPFFAPSSRFSLRPKNHHRVNLSRIQSHTAFWGAASWHNGDGNWNNYIVLLLNNPLFGSLAKSRTGWNWKTNNPEEFDAKDKLKRRN